MMHVVFYHVGEGDLSLVLLPTGDALLVDCYRADEAANGDSGDPRFAWDSIESVIIEHRRALRLSDTDSLGEDPEGEIKPNKIPIAGLIVTHA
jgi:hypothetical protein